MPAQPPVPARHRTAPDSWGEWPPSQERISAAMARAEPTVRERIDRIFGPDAEVSVRIATPADLDLCYVRGTPYSPASESATAGEIWVVGKATKWVVHWDPATDHGVARKMHDYRI